MKRPVLPHSDLPGTGWPSPLDNCPGQPLGMGKFPAHPAGLPPSSPAQRRRRRRGMTHPILKVVPSLSAGGGGDLCRRFPLGTHHPPTPSSLCLLLQGFEGTLSPPSLFPTFVRAPPAFSFIIPSSASCGSYVGPCPQVRPASSSTPSLPGQSPGCQRPPSPSWKTRTTQTGLSPGYPFPQFPYL